MRIGKLWPRKAESLDSQESSPQQATVAGREDTLEQAACSARRSGQGGPNAAAPAPCEAVSGFALPFPRGTKPPGTPMRQSRFGFSCRVAQLNGGQRGPYQLADSSSGAKGGFGKVRLGVDAQGQPVAVKVLRLAHKWDATYPSRLVDIANELDAAAIAGPRCQALDVVQVPGTGKNAGRDKVYVVHELAGGDLFDLCHGPGSERTLVDRAGAQLARHMLAQLAPQLAELHRKGWVHLDLKLENILWSADGTLRLTDFGFATNDLKANLASGTECIIAPEVARGEPRDGRADVWSLGVMLAEVVAPGGQIFTRAGGKDTFIEDRLYLAKQNHDIYARWRAKLPRLDNNDFDLSAIDPASESRNECKDFAVHFAAVRDADPALCQFILGHLLVPKARPSAWERLRAPLVEERATMQEVVAFAETCAPKGRLKRLLKAHRPPSNREDVLRLLRAARKRAARAAEKDAAPVGQG